MENKAQLKNQAHLFSLTAQNKLIKLQTGDKLFLQTHQNLPAINHEATLAIRKLAISPKNKQINVDLRENNLNTDFDQLTVGSKERPKLSSFLPSDFQQTFNLQPKDKLTDGAKTELQRTANFSNRKIVVHNELPSPTQSKEHDA